MNTRIIFALSILIFGNSVAWADEDSLCPGIADALPCHLNTISWVEVKFQGDLLTEHKSSLERLIRLRLRNDLSLLGHEVKSFGDVLREAQLDMRKREVKEKGKLGCLEWTVGEDYPVAYFVECALSGYGIYSNRVFDKFESRALGYSSETRLREQVEDIIRSLVTEISADFLEARDAFR